MIDPAAFMIFSSAARASSPVDVTAHRSCHRCGHRISILLFSYILWVVLQLLNVFYILGILGAILVHRVILGSFRFHHIGLERAEAGSDFFSFATGYHGNCHFNSFPPFCDYFLWTALGLSCAPYFHVMFHLGSLGTNHISTAPPAVPDSAIKYTEVTGGLSSLTKLRLHVEAVISESPGVVLPTTQVDLPSPLVVSVCVSYVTRFGVLYWGEFPLVLLSALLCVFPVLCPFTCFDCCFLYYSFSVFIFFPLSLFFPFSIF